MAIANGLILAVGGLLMAVPIVLHFLMQPKPKLITFPALRFVAPLQRTNRRQLRLKHLLLLLLRVLAILTVAAALAQLSVVSSLFGIWLTLGGVGATGAIVAVLLVAALVWLRPVNRILVAALAAVLLAHLIAAGLLASRIGANEAQPILGDRLAPVAAVIIVDDSPRMTYRYENRTLIERGAIWVTG